MPPHPNTGSMENPERRNNQDQPEQTNFCEWGHMQAAIIQAIKQYKLLSNYFTVSTLPTLQ